MIRLRSDFCIVTHRGGAYRPGRLCWHCVRCVIRYHIQLLCALSPGVCHVTVVRVAAQQGTVWQWLRVQTGRDGIAFGVPYNHPMGGERGP